MSVWSEADLARLQALPPGPTVSLEQQSTRTSYAPRIAANLLPLCGAQNPTAGDGHTRWLEYSDLSVSAIARGAPASVPDRLLNPQAHMHNFSSYGPDTLAAVVLTGVNCAFESVTEANAQALSRHPLHDMPHYLRLAAAAGLVFQAFREQPALFANGVQAWRIQRTRMADNLTAPLKPSPVRYPTKPNMLWLFANIRLHEPQERSFALTDDFADRCLAAARVPGALLVSQADPAHTIVKVASHPGQFVYEFLEGQKLLPYWGLPEPLYCREEGYPSLMASWLLNDLSARLPDSNRAITAAFQEANTAIEEQLRELSPSRG